MPSGRGFWCTLLKQSKIKGNEMKLEGTNGITAEIIQHSKSAYSGDEIITFSLKYGLYVHAEHLRHRAMSFSTKSNRAIPTKRIRREVLANPYVPVKFGANQPGMKANDEVEHKRLAVALWKLSRYPVVAAHWLGEKALGGHKEWLNRMLNPWQYVELCCTATELDNFYNLRIHEDAQGDIKEFAQLMRTLQIESSPEILYEGEWHVPFVERKRDSEGILRYYDNIGSEITAEEACKASSARCARASYNNHDKTSAVLEKDLSLYEKLLNTYPLHASPAEHIATPMKVAAIKFGSPKVKSVMATRGITHVDSNGHLWSGNLKGFIQYRQTLDNHTCWNYSEDDQ